MTALDLSEKQIEGGFFTLSSRRRTPYQWTLNTGGRENFLGTYCESGAPIRDALISMLRDAKKNVFIASFIVGDAELLEEIVAASDRLRGGVYVICALDDRSLRRGLEDEEELGDESPEERKKNFERLTSRGVYVRGHESCHAKFAIADDSVAILGSANFVKNGFEWTGEANIHLTEQVEVRRLKRLFTALWYEGCTFEIPPGINYLVKGRVPTQSPVNYPETKWAPGSVVWTDGKQQTSLLTSINEVIAGARRTLTLSSYSIVGMVEHSEMLIDGILSAVSRGVRVRFFVRQRNAYADQRRELEYLFNQGVEIFGDTRNHAKVAIGDDSDAVLFSANFDAKHGLVSGVEVGYRLSDSGQIGNLIRYIEHAIENADTNYVFRPTLGELDGGLAARWCEKWKYQTVLKVSGMADHLNKYRHAPIVPPVLYEERIDGVIDLRIGDCVISGRVSGDRLIELKSTGNQDEDSSLKLEDWLGSVRQKGDPNVRRRGFFAGCIES